MEVSAGENQHATRRQYDAALRIRLQCFPRLGLRSRVLLDMLGGFLPTGRVTLVVVVSAGAVLHRPSPIHGMERHNIGRLDLVDRKPPVELRVRRRIPSVTMRMKGV